MIHLRIVAPSDRAEMALELLRGSPSVTNVIFLRGAAYKPEGDVILCDVAREDASVILSDLRELEIPSEGSIAMELIDTEISDAAEAAERAAHGAPADAVVWEEIEARTSESAELSAAFLAFMVIATLLAATGLYLDSPILIVGAMVVGPEFGPIAGFCVAVVELRRGLALRSAAALLVGFPLGILAAFGCTLLFRAVGLFDAQFAYEDHELAAILANPDLLSFFVAFAAGVAGTLSLTTAKSGALIGVLISVATIPSAASVGLAAAYRDWSAFSGSVVQLAINILAILAAGMLTLFVQRRLYRRRRRQHLQDPLRERAGLPVGHSRHSVPTIGAGPRHD